MLFPSAFPNRRRARLRASVIASFLALSIAAPRHLFSPIPKPTSSCDAPFRNVTRTIADTPTLKRPLHSSTKSGVISMMWDVHPSKPKMLLAISIALQLSMYVNRPVPTSPCVSLSSVFVMFTTNFSQNLFALTKTPQESSFPKVFASKHVLPQ